MPDLPAIALDGPKGVGKTATASRRAATVHRLDDPGERVVLASDPGRLVSGTTPILIDERGGHCNHRIARMTICSTGIDHAARSTPCALLTDIEPAASGILVEWIVSTSHDWSMG